MSECSVCLNILDYSTDSDHVTLLVAEVKLLYLSKFKQDIRHFYIDFFYLLPDTKLWSVKN